MVLTLIGLFILMALPIYIGLEGSGVLGYIRKQIKTKKAMKAFEESSYDSFRMFLQVNYADLVKDWVSEDYSRIRIQQLNEGMLAPDIHELSSFSELHDITHVLTDARLDILKNSRMREISEIKIPDATSSFAENDYALLFNAYLVELESKVEEGYEMWKDSLEKQEQERLEKLTMVRAGKTVGYRKNALEELRQDDETDVSNFVNLNMRKV